MIAKCQYCGKKFDAKRKTARFCSDLHRTLYNQGKVYAPKKGEKQSDSKSESAFDGKKIETLADEPLRFSSSWVRLIEDYCQEQNITPEDLIAVHGATLEIQIIDKRLSSKKQNTPTKDTDKSFGYKNPKYQALYGEKKKAKTSTEE